MCDKVSDLLWQKTDSTQDLKVIVESLSMRSLKVEEDVRVAREEACRGEERLVERMQQLEVNLVEVKSILEQLIVSKLQL